MTVRSAEDIKVFADRCVFIRSIYQHGRILFELSTPEEKDIMWRTAEVFFGDLNTVLIEYMILQVCKVTDPAKTRHNENHTIDFLLSHYDLISHPKLVEIRNRLHDFRDKLVQARHKLISHSDRHAIISGLTLGAVPQEDWTEFWLDLQDFVCIIYEGVVGERFYINGVGNLSDADSLLKALRHSTYFDKLLNSDNRAISQRCIEMALG